MYTFYRLSHSDSGIIGKLWGVYDYYVHNSTATYHCITPDIEEFTESLLSGGEGYPAYAILCDGEPVGFAQLKKYIHRQACDGVCAEVTIYILPGHTGMGVGRRALELLISEARSSGLQCLCALVSSGNIASEGLFEACGFTKLCVQHKLGVKLGKVLGLDIYELLL